MFRLRAGCLRKRPYLGVYTDEEHFLGPRRALHDANVAAANGGFLQSTRCLKHRLLHQISYPVFDGIENRHEQLVFYVS